MHYSMPPQPRLGKMLRHACRLTLALAFVFLAAGCAGGSRPAYSIDKYLLSWPPSVRDEAGTLPASIKFNRFSVAAAYNSTDMIFRDDDFGFDSFNYSRWAVNPGDMLADGIVADMRTGGIFQAVFSRHETGSGRFVVSGGIEEFYLRSEAGQKKALISVSLAVEDTREKETDKRLLFQKKYHTEESLREQSPRGYARAASRAAQIISREAISDIYAAAKSRLK